MAMYRGGVSDDSSWCGTVGDKAKTLPGLPAKSGSKHDLYHSERNLMDLIGGNPEINVTEFAKAAADGKLVMTFRP